MAITSAFCTSAKQQFLSGSHLATHTYKVALYQSAAVLGASTTSYTTTQEVTGSGYTAGGQALATIAYGTSGTTGYIDWSTDPSWPSSTFTARGALIYNTTGNHAIAVIDFGAEYTATNGTFTLTLPAAGSSAIITIA